jgi:trypsin
MSRFLVAMTISSIMAVPALAKIQKIPNFEQKIVGGIEASLGEFPYIVSLQSGTSHFCGGSLIKKDWVLTAAHCVRANSSFNIVIGLHDRTDLKNAEIMKIKKIIAHPKYNSQTMDSDFALVKLDRESKYTPVALNAVEISIPNIADGEILSTTACWGATKEGSYGLPKNLQKVDVPLVNQEQCLEGYPDEITDTMICAGLVEGGKDSCQGDSGGPLVVKDQNNQDVLVGVVSWGYGCARPKLFGVYSKVSSVAKWIETEIQ